jgi:hypothetical protein
MSFPWDDDQVLFMHRLYVRGDSTQNIAKECSRHFHVEVPISKNAVVGKVHRLHKAYPNAGWDARPSPIRREGASRVTPNRVPPSGPPPMPASTLPPLPSSLVAPPKPFVDHPPTFIAQASSSPPPPAPEPPAFSPPPPPQRRQIQCEGAKGVRRRDGTGCLFPLGDPGSERFHYCDCDLYNLTKPYCEEHADKAYVKERPAKSGARSDA